MEFTFKREELSGDDWPFSDNVTDWDEVDQWDPVEVGTEDSICTLVLEAQEKGVIVGPPGAELHYTYSADSDGGGYLWMVDLKREPSCTHCGRTLQRDWAGEAEARGTATPRDVTLWLDGTDTSYFCPGTGGFETTPEGRWHTPNFEWPLQLRLASNWEEQRKIVTRDATGRQAMIDILQEAVDVANSLLGNLVRWNEPQNQILRDLARMTRDGEEVDGEPFEMENDDAVETLNGLIAQARFAVGREVEAVPTTGGEVR